MPRKLRAINDMPCPTDAQGVQCLLGLVTYLAKFLPKLSTVCESLRRLTDKRSEFEWLQHHVDASVTIKKLITEAPVLNYYHHHYAPSVVNRSAVMDLHRSRSCATLIQSLYDIFVHSFMLSVHIVLGLPRPLLPFILPSISNRCTPFPLIICPKYCHFLF